jgi:long-subunit fatty acid transport protein
MTSRHRLPEVPARARRTGTLAVAVVLAIFGAAGARAQVAPGRDTDSIDITGRQNLTLGSGARAYGMGGAFLARADDATAASWNPAGLSYLRQPELTLVGVHNSFDTQRPSADDLLQQENDNFTGGAIDFAAFTWPITIGEVGGSIQVSYQRAVSFDGRRRIDVYGTPTAPEDGGDEQAPVAPAAVNPNQPVLRQHTDGSSDGGFDVVAFGTGLRLSRRVRLGLTVNRWTNGYDQLLRRQYVADPTPRPVREFGLDFRPSGWSFNLGVIFSPIEQVNLAAVYKTAPDTDVRLDKSRRDTWGAPGEVEEVTSNAYSNPDARLDLPSSYGFGVSWRPRDTLTLSADFTRARWSEALIDGYFDLPRTARSDEDGNPAPKPPPFIRAPLQYPTLRDPTTELALQTDAEQLRLGLEYVFLTRRLKVPLRVGYFSDRQITPNPTGDIPRFNGLTAGIGVVLGSMLLDVAYVYEFGEYSVSTESVGESPSNTQIRYALTTNRVYASVIYRFSGRP